MPVPRHLIVDPDEVGIYHCITRCVRQMYLLNLWDAPVWENVSRWTFCEKRMEFLASVYYIDILDHAFLSNHIHSICRIRPDVAKTAPDEDVAVRWLRLHPIPQRPNDRQSRRKLWQYVRRMTANRELMAKARRALCSLSHFQKSLLEPIAKEMNKRDGVKGHFVSERFRCVRIESEEALLVCSVYVALNPFRAGLGESIAAHPFNSYSHRLQNDAPWLAPLSLDPHTDAYAAELQPIVIDGVTKFRPQANACGAPRNSDKGYLHLGWTQYRQVVEWTADHLQKRKTKRRQGEIIDIEEIPAHLGETLERLGICPDMWLEVIEIYQTQFHCVIGNAEALDALAIKRGRKFFRGIRWARRAFQPPRPPDPPDPSAPTGPPPDTPPPEPSS